VAVRLQEKAIRVITSLARRQILRALQARCWGSIPILNQWHALKHDTDPVVFHQQYWHTRLVCPGGGAYVWDEEFGTMASTVFGCPARPKMPDKLPGILEKMTEAAFGMTFEDDGLRARAAIGRSAVATD